MTREMRDRVELGGEAATGWHSAYRRADGALVVEWLEYRDHAPYDHATKIVFDTEQEAKLSRALGSAADRTIFALAERFSTYWDVRSFADAHTVEYQPEVDFTP